MEIIAQVKSQVNWFFPKKYGFFAEDQGVFPDALTAFHCPPHFRQSPVSGSLASTMYGTPSDRSKKIVLQVSGVSSVKVSFAPRGGS